MPGISPSNIPNKTIRPAQLLRRGAGILLLCAWGYGVVATQLTCVWLPFVRYAADIPRRLKADEFALLRLARPDVSSLIAHLRTYHPSERFYFVPCFSDSRTTAIDWWYLYILCRYFSWPRQVYCLHPSLYHDDKTEYEKKYVRGARNYSELPWLTSRGVRYIILYRNNTINILPLDSPIRL